MSRRMLKIVGFALYNSLVYNNSMTHRDITTLTKFKTMGFKDIHMKFIPEIKLNRITCTITEKVGKSYYDIPFECFADTSNKIIVAKHYLFEAVIDAYKEFSSKEYKEKVAYLESVGLK
jgi:hypothetical protein